MTQTPASTLLGRLSHVYRGDSLAGVLTRGASWSFGFRVAALALGAGTQFVLARVLGNADYGIYTYTLGWMNVILVLTKFDFDAVGVKYVSTYSTASEWGLLRGFQTTAFRFTAVFSLLVGGAVAAGLQVFGSRLAADLRLPALVTCAMLPLVTLAAVQSGALQGRKLIAQSEIHTILRPILLLTTVGVVVLGMQRPLDATGALLIGWTATAVAVAFNGVLVRVASADTRSAERRFRLREWFGTAAGLLPASLSQLTLGTTTDVVIVGSIIGTTAAGVYSIAALLLMPAGFVIISVAAIAAPMIADLYANDRLGELRQLMILVGRINIALTVPLALVIFLVAPVVLSWFGPAFREGYPVVLILGIGSLSATLGGHAALMLTMTGHHNTASVIIGSSAVLNLVLAVVLAPVLGLIGVATATGIATMVRNVWLTVAATRRTGVSLLPI